MQSVYVMIFLPIGAKSFPRPIQYNPSEWQCYNYHKVPDLSMQTPFDDVNGKILSIVYILLK